MKKIKLPSGRPSLPYTDFIHRVGEYRCSTLSNDALAAMLREPDALLEQKYAVLKEIIRRKTGLSLFDTQLATAYGLQQGNIVELPTGEGKTLAAVVAAVYLALEGRRVHLLVFNDYLARRDHADNEAIYHACSLCVGSIDQNSTKAERIAAYACNVVYVSAKEAAFDHLRDFLCTEPGDLIFPGFDAAIVDEADSILIDEAGTPLVLAGQKSREDDQTARIGACAAELNDGDVETGDTEGQIWLTDQGITHVEELLGEPLYGAADSLLQALVQSALEARFLLQCDKDYIIREGAVRIIEPTTGRVVENCRYPDLLHRAVEVKEGIEPAPRTIIYNSMTMRSFLLQYKSLCGMTGTAATAAGELRDSYGLHVEVIPPHTPCIRIDRPDRVCADTASHRVTILEEIRRAQSIDRPVLLGTQSVAESEVFSTLLTDACIPHCVLNARDDRAEASIIARAGELSRVTISTNMAGRGTDIRLGGPAGTDRAAVAAAGGLLVLSTTLNSSVRIDNQLRGRAGRQGDPGESLFILCAENVPMAVGRNTHKSHRRLQRKTEGDAAGARYSLLRYAHILEQQRRIITAWRTRVLLGEQSSFFAVASPELYGNLCARAGKEGVHKAEQQLILHYSNQCWADYLAAMEPVRDAVHFSVIAQRDPLDEYHRAAIELYDRMEASIHHEVLEGLRTLPITADGIDMDAAGLAGGTTTWSYQIDEQDNQFSRVPYAIAQFKKVIEKLRWKKRGGV